MKQRKYCWRTGVAVTLEDNEPCDECGHVNHKPIEDQNTCGNFVSRSDTGGNPCKLPINHSGKCSLEPEEILNTIHTE